VSISPFKMPTLFFSCDTWQISQEKNRKENSHRSLQRLMPRESEISTPSTQPQGGHLFSEHSPHLRY
jgi:hypothetical protein